jgi:hypothetical protein
LPASLRLIRFARVTALVADLWTIFCAVLVVCWQVLLYIREGSWNALPLAFVFKRLEYRHGEIYATSGIDTLARGYLTDLRDILLQVPVIVPLLVAAALLTAFYSWLSKAERLYSGNQNHMPT